MGDHRQASADSRAFGPIGEGTVIGRARLSYWPISTLGILQTPVYPAPVGNGDARPQPGRPVTWLLVAAGGVVALGAGVAIGARAPTRDRRGPPGPGVLALPRRSPSRLARAGLPDRGRGSRRVPAPGRVAPCRERRWVAPGPPAALAVAAAAFAAGLGATAVGLPFFGPTGALAAGLACIVVAIPLVTRVAGRFRLGRVSWCSSMARSSCGAASSALPRPSRSW